MASHSTGAHTLLTVHPHPMMSRTRSFAKMLQNGPNMPPSIVCFSYFSSYYYFIIFIYLIFYLIFRKKK